VIAKTGIGAFGKFLKSELQRHGVVTDYLQMDHRTNTTVIFVSSTATTPDFEEFRIGDFLLETQEIPDEAIDRAKVVHSSTFAHEVAALKLGVEGHVERMIDRDAIYRRLEGGAGGRA